jgi:hypothetical protein
MFMQGSQSSLVTSFDGYLYSFSSYCGKTDNKVGLTSIDSEFRNEKCNSGFTIKKNYKIFFDKGIVSDYGLDDRAIGVRFQEGAKNFSSNLCVQTGTEARPVFNTMSIGGPFAGAKRGRGVTLTTHPHLVPRSRMSRSYTSSPPKRHHGV